MTRSSGFKEFLKRKVTSPWCCVCINSYRLMQKKLECKEIDFISFSLYPTSFLSYQSNCLFTIPFLIRNKRLRWSMESLNGKYVCIMLRKYLNDCSSCIPHIRESINLFHHAYAHHTVKVMWSFVFFFYLLGGCCGHETLSNNSCFPKIRSCNNFLYLILFWWTFHLLKNVHKLIFNE